MAEPSIVFTDVNERQGVFTRRIFLMGGLVAFGLVALTGRLAHLQLLQGSKYSKLAAANQFNFRLIPPPRGDIYDRNGKLIAGNRPSFRVMIESNEVKSIEDTLDQVSYILPQTLSSRRRILRDISQNQRSVPTVIASDMSWDDFSKISLYANDIPGVVADMDEVRAYYYGGAFSHVVGYVSKVSQRDLDKEKNVTQADSNLLHHPSFRIGKSGIEKGFDQVLRGTAGGKKIEVDAQGHVVAENTEGSIPPVPGQDIVLTLDADIQQRAMDVFGTDSGSAVMMDIHTGDVLCMTSNPGFDPNLFVSGISSKAYRLLADYDHLPLLDKALTATYPPGSTFKTMVALAALENGYDPKTTHTCNGSFPFGNRVFHCDGRHGTLDLHGAIVTSCDVYFYQCALAIGPDKIANVARKFGLGQIFDIGIDGQKAGIVPDQAWKANYFAKRNPANTKWYPGETPSMGIGQGYTNVNALQNCVMVARLANGLKAVEPRLIKSVGGKPYQDKPFEDMSADPAHVAFVRQAMADVVTSGTAARTAKLDLGPIMMAGKTGTAQSHTITSGSRATLHLDWARRDHAWFVAFAPADAPKYALSVIVQHGGWGSSSAAPKAREIMRMALLKDPDIQKRMVEPVKDTFDPAALKAAEAAAAADAPDIPAPPTDIGTVPPAND
ncbi:MAG: penicillin-binding protein 2 [Asticcacaulis sp.]